MNEIQYKKMLSRVVHAIHTNIDGFRTRHQNVIPAAPCVAWNECNRGLARLRAAAEKGWPFAAKHARIALIRKLEDLDTAVRTVIQKLDVPQQSHRTTLRDVYLDVQGLQTEYQDVKLDLAQRTLSVITEPIELDGIQLGKFEIDLNWEELAKANEPAYRIRALDPNPAALNDECFHPHVQNQLLCEGEAKQLIRLALEQGRVFDFFNTIACTLRTYNSGSAYVSLSDWQGVRCADCDGIVLEDDSSRCSECESQLCDECVRVCAGCSEAHCSECIRSCNSCGEGNCNSCQRSCLNCCENYCSACLDERGICDVCQQTKTTRLPTTAAQRALTTSV